MFRVSRFDFRGFGYLFWFRGLVVGGCSLRSRLVVG